MVKKNSLSTIGEFGLIDLIRKRASLDRRVIQGIGDDAAVLPLNVKKYLLLTTDMITENRHFTLKDNPRFIGRKALAVNISDIAAMAGVSTFAVVSLGVSKTTSLNVVKEIYRGIEDVARAFKVSLVGGDTVKTKRLTINIALLGEVEKNRIALRRGAKKGDEIFVTGPLGNSLRNNKHLLFTPRQQEARMLARFFQPTSMIDISDGFIADLNHILSESRVGAVVNVNKIPRNRGANLTQALNDGEDFELIFTLSAQKAEVFKRQRKLPCFHVGTVTGPREGLRFMDAQGRIQKPKIKGYRHF